MKRSKQKISNSHVTKVFKDLLNTNFPTYSYWGWDGDAVEKNPVGVRSCLAQNTDTDYARAIIAVDRVEKSFLSIYSGIVYVDYIARVYSSAEIFEEEPDEFNPMIPFSEAGIIHSHSELVSLNVSRFAWRDWMLNTHLVLCINYMMAHGVREA